MALANEVLLPLDCSMVMMSTYQRTVHLHVLYSSTSNPAARKIRAAVLNSRFKCSSGACGEIEGVMEISDFCFLEFPKKKQY